MKKKALVIRFSSIGDIIQCMSVIEPIVHQLDAEVHWISRSDFTPMLKTNPDLHKIWSYERKTGMKGLVKMIAELRKEKFDYVYDAHQNIRSYIVRTLLFFPRFRWDMKFTVRRKNRFRRFFFFQLNIRKAIKMPFRAVESFLIPLKKWDIDISQEYKPEWTFTANIVDTCNALVDNIFDKKKVITLVPSAAWELKRWPVEYWQELVRELADFHFVIIGGPDDTFTNEIENVAPERVINLSGKTSLQASFYIINISQLVISADTGFLHAADLFKVNAIALMGPTAFGHPTGRTVRVMEINGLSCRPCTKAGNTVCTLPNEYRACLLNIKPEMVIEAMRVSFGI